MIEVWADTIHESLDRFEGKNFMLYQYFCQSQHFVGAVSAIIGILVSTPQ